MITVTVNVREHVVFETLKVKLNLTFLFLRALWVWRQRLVRSKDGHDWLIHKRV